MNRKAKIRQMRKNIMRMGKIVRAEVLDKDDDGRILPKKEWGYCIEVHVNGHRIVCPDDTWYNAYKGALCACQWASEQPPFSLTGT